jgi:DNA-binding XRE family transcriptional regulator
MYLAASPMVSQGSSSRCFVWITAVSCVPVFGMRTTYTDPSGFAQLWVTCRVQKGRGELFWTRLGTLIHTHGMDSDSERPVHVPTWDLADRLRKVRRDSHLSQRDFAYALGLKETTYAAYESGRNSPQRLLDLAHRVQAAFDGSWGSCRSSALRGAATGWQRCSPSVAARLTGSSASNPYELDR